MNKGSSGRGQHGNFSYGGQHQGYGNNTNQILLPYPYPHPVYPPPVPKGQKIWSFSSGPSITTSKW